MNRFELERLKSIKKVIFQYQKSSYHHKQWGFCVGNRQEQEVLPVHTQRQDSDQVFSQIQFLSDQHHRRFLPTVKVICHIFYIFLGLIINEEESFVNY